MVGRTLEWYCASLKLPASFIEGARSPEQGVRSPELDARELEVAPSERAREALEGEGETLGQDEEDPVSAAPDLEQVVRRRFELELARRVGKRQVRGRHRSAEHTPEKGVLSGESESEPFELDGVDLGSWCQE